MKKTERKAREKTNPTVLSTVIALNKTKSRLWKDIAERIVRPTRQMKGVPLWRINKHTKEGDVVVVPGKVLGNGEMDHKVTVAALGYSQKAAEKLKAAKCKTHTIRELAEKNPKGSGIRIIG